MMEKNKERRQQNKYEYFLSVWGRQWGWGSNRLAGFTVSFKAFKIRHL